MFEKTHSVLAPSVDVDQPAQKGSVGYHVPPQQFVTQKVLCSARYTTPYVDRALYHAPFIMEELKKFLGILLYVGENRTKKLADLWNTKEGKPQHVDIQFCMSSKRFKLLYHSFRFAEQQVNKRIPFISVNLIYCFLDD